MNMILVERICPFCGEKMALWINEDEYQAWESGVPSQTAFPNLDEGEREFIISGICENCWEKLFG